MSRINLLFCSFLVLCSAIRLTTYTRESRDLKCTRAKFYQNSSNWMLDCSRKNLTSLYEICNNSTLMLNVTYLDVSHNNISYLQGGLYLNGCSGLKCMDLHNNTLTTISEDAFDKMNELQMLDLSFNNLQVYTKDSGTIFKELETLQALFLNRNFKQKKGLTLSYPDLSNLTSLVNLSMDGLPDTPFDSSFSKLTNLTGLFMSGQSGMCNLGLLQNDTFQHLPHIEILKLSHCNISNIELLTFSVLPKLRWLDLSYNQRLGFETLHNVSFGLQFTDIKFLNYSYVYNTYGVGTVIRKHSICYLWNTSLQEISLSNNRVEIFETNALMLLPKSLQTVHADHNDGKFQAYFFQLCCLNFTNFYANHMKARSPIMNVNELYFKEPQYPPNADVYKLSNDCPFMDKSRLINRSTDECPYLNEDRAPKKNEVRACLPNYLRNVSITDSQMNYKVQSSKLTFPLKFVEFLNVSGNYLDNWIDLFSFEGLKTLDFSRNNCKKISRTFFKKTIYIENIQAAQNLIGLDSENINAFQNLTFLKTLNLSDNRIVTVPSQALYGLNHLEILDLSVNLLRDWTCKVDTLSNLTTLCLKNNFLEGLPEYLTSHLVTVSNRLKIPFTLDLRGNQLKLSCKYQTFLKWVIEHKNNIVGFDEMQFNDDNDAPVASSKIEFELERLEIKCRSNTVWIVLSTIGVSLSLSLIVGGLVYRNRWKLRYFLYMSKQRFYGYVKVPNEDPIENYKYDAFISYAEENLRFIKEQIIPRIEQNGLSLCIHQRDFLPGHTIADNIVDAIKSSRKTVVLLTKAFLKSKWCMYEFNMARMEHIYSREDRVCLVVVMLEQVQVKDMPLEMINFIKTESYIEYTTELEGQVMFWNELKTIIAT